MQRFDYHVVVYVSSTSYKYRPSNIWAYEPCMRVVHDSRTIPGLKMRYIVTYAMCECFKHNTVY